MGEMVNKVKDEAKQAVGAWKGDKALQRQGNWNEAKGQIQGAVKDTKGAAKGVVNDAKRGIKRAAK